MKYNIKNNNCYNNKSKGLFIVTCNSCFVRDICVAKSYNKDIEICKFLLKDARHILKNNINRDYDNLNIVQSS